MVTMVMVGEWWINLAQVRMVEKRESGAAVVHLVGGQEIALLPDEAVTLERELVKSASIAVSRFPSGAERRGQGCGNEAD